MTKYAYAMSTIMIALLAQPIFLSGQTSADWASVKVLPVGTNVRVETNAKKRFEGVVKAVSDTLITITTKSETETFQSSDVKKLFRVEAGSRGKWAAIGAAIGAGIGAGLGLALLGATGGSDNTGAVIAPIIGAGAGVGGGLGAAFPGKKRTLIYESR